VLVCCQSFHPPPSFTSAAHHHFAQPLTALAQLQLAPDEQAQLATHLQALIVPMVK
jgi:hypothetical protein